MRKIFVLIPVLNEAPNIPRLAESILKWKEEIPLSDFLFVFINDGSTDETPALLDALGNKYQVITLHHSSRFGPGKAFGTGFTYLKGILTENDLVVTMEGDNTSRPQVLKIMIGRVEREDADVVLASPYSYGGGMTNTSFLRILLSHVANGLMKMVLNFRGINTFSSFYRLYKGSAVLKMQGIYGPGIIETPGFECMVELLYKIVINGFSISEVPMKLDTSLRAGKSKMKILKTIWGYLKIVLIKNKWEKK